jgi:hypothetical protein
MHDFAVYMCQMYVKQYIIRKLALS